MKGTTEGFQYFQERALQKINYSYILSNQKCFQQQHLLYLKNERKNVFKIFKNYKQSKEKHISENEFLENNIKVIKQIIEINQIFLGKCQKHPEGTGGVNIFWGGYRPFSNFFGGVYMKLIQFFFGGGALKIQSNIRPFS